jgi:hypothetical protein
MPNVGSIQACWTRSVRPGDYSYTTRDDSAEVRTRKA